MKMLKYKLIKEYPGSPKLGTVVTLETAVNGQIIQGKWCYDIDNAPEFWEKVIEKEYEILSFKKRLTGDIYNLSSDGKYRFNSGYVYMSEWEVYFTIHSVKRIYDGEIFTVGDNISHSYKGVNNETITKEYKIEKIYFIEKERLSFYVGGGLSLGIKNVLKLKQPLFTTEDGVDIYEPSTRVFYVCRDWRIYSPTVISQAAKENKCYSTKEAAEEYLLMNKPCLSINDILTRYNYKWAEIGKLSLKELVKQKIK